MAQWQIFKGKTASGAPVQVGEQFDDGRIEQPGVDGFTTDLVKQECAKRKGDGWSYIGRSTVYAPAMDDHIAARTAPIIEVVTADIQLQMVRDIVGEIPEGEERLKSEVEREAADRVAALADDIAAKARAAVLYDLGLREG